MAGKANPKSRVHDFFTAFLGLSAAGVLVSSPWQVDTSGPYPFYKGALIFPLLALGLMVLASVPSIIRLFRSSGEASWYLDGGGIPVKPIGVLTLVVAFLAGIPFVGLELSSFLFLAATLFCLGHRSAKIYLGMSLLLTVLLYLVFKYFLDVYFPTPWLFQLLGG